MGASCSSPSSIAIQGSLPYRVEVSIIQGRKIKGMDNNGGASDPFVCVSVGGTTYTTSSRSSTTTPVWNSRFVFRGGVDNKAELPTSIKLACLDKDTFSKDDHIGDAAIDLAPLWTDHMATVSETTSNPVFAEWVSLNPADGGEIQVVARALYGQACAGMQFDATDLLVVRVPQARALVKSDVIGQGDNFVTVSWGMEQFASPYVKNSSAPVWGAGAQCAFWVNRKDHAGYSLHITVADRDSKSKSQTIGSVYIPAQQILALVADSTAPPALSASPSVETARAAETKEQQSPAPSATEGKAYGESKSGSEEKDIPTSATMGGWLSLQNIIATDKNLSGATAAGVPAVVFRPEGSDVVKDASGSTGLGEVFVEVELVTRSEVEDRYFTHLLSKYDLDGDGTISMPEFATLIASIGADVDPDTVLKLFSEADADKSGAISQSEIGNLMRTVAYLDPSAAESFIKHIKHACIKPQPDFMMDGVTYKRSSSQIPILDRKTGLQVMENIPTYIATSLKVMFGTRLSRKISSGGISVSLMTKLSKAQGEKFSKPESVAELDAFINLHSLNLDEVEKPLSEYKTFNEFFARGLKPSARPIAAPTDPKVAVSAADCRLTVFPRISDATSIWIKGDKFTIDGVLGPHGSAEASKLVGGPMAIFRLAPQDYHRWHIPVTGQMLRSYAIDGALFTVNPLAINKNVNVYTENKREVYVIDSPEFGTVVLVAVGATCVGSITTLLQPPCAVTKGDVHGYFSFGGSTVLAFFEPRAIEFDKDLITNTNLPIETLVQVNSRIGVATGQAPSVVAKATLSASTSTSTPAASAPVTAEAAEEKSAA